MRSVNIDNADLTSLPKMARVITMSELERMRSSIAPSNSADKDRSDRKAELKQLSISRVQHWPNTLEANRTKKLSIMKDREAQEELKRQQVDIEEAELRRQSRLESITRANNLLNEQTDKMKNLKSQKLYSDVIHNRKQQILDLVSVKAGEKSYEATMHQCILEQVRKGEQEEKMKAAEAEHRTRLIAEARRAQLDEAVARKEADVRETKLIGLAMKKRSEEMLVEEQYLQALKQERANENKIEVVRANDKLKLMRIHMTNEERRSEEARDAEIRVVDDRKNALKQIGILHYEKAQKKRQVIIDAAAKNLAEKTNNEREILYKQETDIKEREEREFAEKEMKKCSDWRSTVESRTRQINHKEEQDIAEMEEEQRLANMWRRNNESAIEEDRTKNRQSRDRIKEVKSAQLNDSIAVQRRKIDQRIAEIESDRKLQEAEGDVDARFVSACKEEIKRYAAESKPLLPLLAALHHKQPDIIPGRKIALPTRTTSA